MKLKLLTAGRTIERPHTPSTHTEQMNRQHNAKVTAALEAAKAAEEALKRSKPQAIARP